MSRAGEARAAKARSLVGTPFRPQGRDPMTGLDCAGTAAAAAGVPLDQVRRDYSLRGQSLAQIEHGLCDFGCRPVTGHVCAVGDVIVCRVAPGRFHIVFCTGRSFVHADAGLGRVVERPMPIPWPIVGVWRPFEEDEEA